MSAQEAVREDGPSYLRKAEGYTRQDTFGEFATRGGFQKNDTYTVGRNIRTVWNIATQPFSGAHFATFPEELVRRCLLAGTSEKGCCPKCGGPWVRVVESKPATSRECPKTIEAHYARGGIGNPIGTVGKSGSGRIEGYTKTLGWRPSCKCGEERTVPAIVFDPFFGAGTVGVVAQKYNRRFVGLELKPEYCQMAQKRVNSQPVAMI